MGLQASSLIWMPVTNENMHETGQMKLSGSCLACQSSPADCLVTRSSSNVLNSSLPPFPMLSFHFSRDSIHFHFNFDLQDRPLPEWQLVLPCKVQRIVVSESWKPHDDHLPGDADVSVVVRLFL